MNIKDIIHKTITEELKKKWKLFFGSLISGLLLITTISATIGKNPEWILIETNEGVTLNGSYNLNPLFPLLFLLTILILIAAIYSYFVIMNNIPARDVDLIKSHLIYDDMLFKAKKICNSLIFPNNASSARFDFIKVSMNYHINQESTAFVEREITIKCAEEYAIALQFTIFADDESKGIIGLSPLDLSITDLDTEKDLNWMQIEDNLRQKKIVVFLSEIAKRGDEKNILIKYTWPNLFKRVLDRGSAKFSWSNESSNLDTNCEVTYSWTFLKGFPHVLLEILDENENSYLTTENKAQDVQKWIYKNEKAITDGRVYDVHISLSNEESLTNRA